MCHHNSTKYKVVFLYTELAGYMLTSIKKAVEKFNVDVHIIQYPVNKDAPFKFEENKNITHYYKNNYTTKELFNLVDTIQPDIILASGWIDKSYLRICKYYYNTIPIVITADNPWTGAIRQRIATILSPFFVLNKFSYAWVTGINQYKYMSKLGFKKGKIFTGFYSADFDFFQQQYQIFKKEKHEKFPKRFLYVGRYNIIKGIHLLWEAFIRLNIEIPENEWELWCVGTGEYNDIFPKHPKIKNKEFVQQKELGEIIRNTGVFVFPSNLFEHWGVALHEFASAGYPLVCSDMADASTAFIKRNVNGFMHKAGDVNSLKEAMKKITSLSDAELLKMGEKSIELAQQITPDIWAKTLMNIISDFSQRKNQTQIVNRNS